MRPLKCSLFPGKSSLFAFLLLLLSSLFPFLCLASNQEGNPGITPIGTDPSIGILQIPRIPEECWKPSRLLLAGEDASKTSAFGRAQIPSVDCWLNHSPKVASWLYWEEPWPYGPIEWKNWSAARKKSLRENFAVYWNLLGNNLQGSDPDPMVDPPPNQVPLKDNEDVVQILSPDDAWKMYIKHVGLSLAVEMKAYVSWSVQSYDTESLRSLFDSRRMFQWQNAWTVGVPGEGHEGYVMTLKDNGAAIPASPLKEISFLATNGLVALSRKQTIGKLLEWSHQLTHMLSWPNGSNKTSVMQNYWQYRGWPPVLRMLDGTAYSGPPTNVDNPYLRFYTLGCYGTSGFLKALLRTVNIPVEMIDRGHYLPHFMPHLYLSHGDDPYGTWKAIPPIPAEKLLINQDRFEDWFVNASDQEKYVDNIGRQVRELHIDYLPNILLHKYCEDLANGESHASGQVLKFFSSTTVKELEDRTLWERLETKVQSFGGCQGGQLPPS